MAKRAYSLDELLLNESFIEWVHEQETSYWPLWVDASAEDQKLIAQARNIILAQQFKRTNLTEDKVTEIKLRIDENILQQEDKKQSFKLIKMNTWLGRAAVIVLVISSLAFLYYKVENNTTSDHSQMTAEVKLINKTTPNGLKQTVYLSDGTEIKLNNASQLIYPEKFGNDIREVYLHGEAFFKVTKDSSRPFIITSGNIKTTVLGTSFNIKAYKADKTVEVALVTGRVSLQRTTQGPDDSTVYLEPNEMLIYNKESESTEKKSFDPHKVLAWKRKVLLFEDASLEEVLASLERWYDVTFVNTYNGPIEHGFSATYENKSINAVMEGVSFAYGFKYEIKDKIIIIK